MAKIVKYKNTTEIKNIIKHNIREFEDGISKTNPNIDPEKKSENYSLINGGKTAAELNKIRCEIEAQGYKYNNRKDLVKCLEIVITAPDKLTAENEHEFFQACYDFVSKEYAHSSSSIFLAEVHKDEKFAIIKGSKKLYFGKPHIHLMMVPLAKYNNSDQFQYKLCANEFCKKKDFRNFHKNLDSFLQERNLPPTLNGKTKGGDFSVKTMKELTKNLGLSIDEVKSLSLENQRLKDELVEKDKIISNAEEKLKEMEAEKRIDILWEQDSWGNSKGDILW